MSLFTGTEFPLGIRRVKWAAGGGEPAAPNGTGWQVPSFDLSPSSASLLPGASMAILSIPSLKVAVTLPVPALSGSGISR